MKRFQKVIIEEKSEYMKNEFLFITSLIILIAMFLIFLLSIIELLTGLFFIKVELTEIIYLTIKLIASIILGWLTLKLNSWSGKTKRTEWKRYTGKEYRIRLEENK